MLVHDATQNAAVFVKVTKYVQPTRDGEIDRWCVTWEGGDREDLESFEVRVP